MHHIAVGGSMVRRKNAGKVKMTTLTQTFGRYHSVNRSKKKKIKIGIQFSSKIFNVYVLAFSFFLIMGMSYLYSINRIAVKGYQFKQVEKDITLLLEENEKLKIKEAELKSLYRIKEAGKRMNMTELQNLDYVEDFGPMALR